MEVIEFTNGDIGTIQLIVEAVSRANGLYRRDHYITERAIINGLIRDLVPFVESDKVSELSRKLKTVYNLNRSIFVGVCE